MQDLCQISFCASRLHDHGEDEQRTASGELLTEKEGRGRQ